MHIINAIKNILENKPILFTTPGHSQGSEIFPEIEDLIGKKSFKCDLSEIIGLDNLQEPTGVILKSQLRASEIYGSKYSYYLVNGSSSGIIALMLATVSSGDKVLIARNAHKSVINALVLSGAVPIWINTEWLQDWDVPGEINPEQVKEYLNTNPDIKAVWLTNPTYEGIITDIASIVKICREKEVLLIVDEAHGSLWNFNDNLPIPSIHYGADASVQSLHKTASCLTQGAIMHIGKNSKIDPDKLQQCLNIINTTSPSYLILASIEGAIEHLNSNHGHKKIEDLLKNIDKFKHNLSKYKKFRFLDKNNSDKTKILMSMEGITGFELAEALETRFNIEVELNNNKSITALTGIGTSEKALNKLANAVIELRKSFKKTHKSINKVFPLIQPKMILTPRQAFYQKFKIIDIKSSLGLISKETIVAYPPGIPLIISGEMIQQEHIELLDKIKEISVILD